MKCLAYPTVDKDKNCRGAIVSPSNLIAQREREEGESAPCVFVIKRRRGGETIKEARHKKRRAGSKERSDLKILL